MTNPFQHPHLVSASGRPATVVIFGATGDLTHRKLVPALYNLAVDALLPSNFQLVGAARRELTSEKYREDLKVAVDKFSRRRPTNEAVWSEFAKNTHYCAVPFDDPAGYLRLKALLDDLDSKSGHEADRIFYLATSPEYFAQISRQLSAAGLLADLPGGRKSRVVVEKPFGRDLPSARELNHTLLSSMREEQIYRIDHYLGKETVQNLLVFRFANGIFEPIWNHKYISAIEISVCESLGVGSRAGYFDQSGILRDIVQNHVLQLLCLVALEPPIAFEADAVRDEKVKVLRSVRRYADNEVGKYVVRGRYQSGSVHGEPVIGYLGEEGVAKDSTTETYVAMQLTIDSWRWAGVPFFIRAGKRLPKRITEIAIYFRSVPHLLFKGEGVSDIRPNVLSFQIQPDEGISLKMSSKPPGPRVRVQSVNMDFSYGASFGVEAPEAYERLLLDCMRGDATLFTRDDEIEQAWDLLAPVLNVWSGAAGRTPPVYGYEAGTWGPQAADELMTGSVGRGWRRL